MKKSGNTILSRTQTLDFFTHLLDLQAERYPDASQFEE